MSTVPFLGGVGKGAQYLSVILQNILPSKGCLSNSHSTRNLENFKMGKIVDKFPWEVPVNPKIIEFPKSKTAENSGNCGVKVKWNRNSQ